MAEQDSHSIPRVWRLHKYLWELNKESLANQMDKASQKLKSFEKNQLDQEKIELIIGQLATSTIVE